MDYVESEGEEDIDYDKLNAAQNRKHKKAGGWQTLGNNYFMICNKI